jgi:hypothetical protein
MTGQPPNDATTGSEPNDGLAIHRTDNALLWLAAIGSTIAWIVLYRWYGVFENEHNTHFAFEKIAGYFDSPIIRQTLALFILIGLLYGLAIWLLHRSAGLSLSGKLALLTIFLGPAIVNVCLYPVGALDVFNYMIELKLTYHYDQNPYLVTFSAYRQDSFALPAFLVDIRLFYGTAWLVFSWIPTSITGFTDVLTTLLGLKIYNVALLIIGAFIIARYQDSRRAAWIAGALFLANPVVLFEGVANAHNDVMMTMFLLGAFLALKHRSPLAGPMLALAALVKFNPLVLVPLMLAVMIRDKWELRRLVVTGALTLLAVAAVSFPWWSDGELIDGITSGLEQSQRMDHVSVSSLTRQWFQDQDAQNASPAEANIIRMYGSYDMVAEQIRNRIDLVYGAGIAVITLLIAFAVWRGAPVEPAAAATLLILIVFGTNFYAWYLIPVFALLLLNMNGLSLAYIAIASTTALVYYPMFVYAHFSTDWHRFQVHQFLALFLTFPAVALLLLLGISPIRRHWSSRRSAVATGI